MIGLALLAIGAVLLWAAATKRGDAVVSALGMNLPGSSPPSTTGSGGESSGGSGGSSGGNPDSGSHMGLDANGNVVVIDKPYGDMTDAEKDAANKFAHQIGNTGGAI